MVQQGIEADVAAGQSITNWMRACTSLGRLVSRYGSGHCPATAPLSPTARQAASWSQQIRLGFFIVGSQAEHAPGATGCGYLRSPVGPTSSWVRPLSASSP